MKNSILFIIILMLTGCSKNFLNLEPQADMNAENFYKTDNDFNAALTGAYAALQSYPDMYFEMSSYRSDELTLGAPTAGTQDRYDIDRFQDNSANNLTLSTWRSLYDGINRCNEIISRIANAGFADNLKKQYEAEARFLRAYHYYNLVNLYGSIPLVLTPLSPAQSLQTGQAPTADIYNAITEDLNFAMSTTNLPAAFTGTNTGRATSTAARALLGRAYIAQKKYAEAKDLLEPLVNNSGTYGLMNTTGEVFLLSNRYNKEILFAVRFAQGHGLWLSVTSATASQVPAKFLSGYSNADNRKALLTTVRFGSSGNRYQPLKFLGAADDVNANNASNEFILLRYADVLLMYAEALNETGYQANGAALASLNKIHTRAGLAAFTATDLPTQAAFRQAIYNERKLELAYEGNRWFDLVRTEQVAEVIQNAESITVPAFRKVFPIPNQEIEKINNPQLLRQNEGYN